MFEHERWQEERAALVCLLRAAGIRDERVLAALGRVPRHQFVNHDRAAYLDQPLPIASGQTISQPYMVAYMTEALEGDPAAKVLEVGTGSGYQGAILAELYREVWSIERLANLAESARSRLQALGYANLHVVVGDGTLGYPEQAPYDRILGTAALPAIPPPWVEQLAEEGIIVAPVGDRWQQVLVIAHKHQGELDSRRDLPCRFVPMLGRYGFSD